VDEAEELVAKDTVVATWTLQRKSNWAELRKAVVREAHPVQSSGKETVKADWLALAELSTYSRSSGILPRSIYLSHQFSFHSLREDYHALIRQHQFDIAGPKIEVRREVEVSAYATSGAVGESFVEGFSTSPHERIRSRNSASFDEPLASALAGGLQYPLPPPILPMFPNGMPNSKPKSFRNSIPIRTMAGIGDGMSEGLGRLRKEMHRHRAARLSPPPLRDGEGSIAGSVPLEFDEEDEDFVIGPRDIFEPAELSRSHNTTTSRGPADSVESLSTPATSAHTLDEEEVSVEVKEEGEGGKQEGEEIWHGGWSSEDAQAVEEAERFDDISVVGFLDEEQASMRAAEAENEKRKMKGRGRRRM